MKHAFVAFDIPVLNLSHSPDSSGQIIPPEAVVSFKETMPVTYGPQELEYVAGWARLRRAGNQILADMTLYSVMPDKAKSLKLMRLLTPATEFTVLKMEWDEQELTHKNIVFGLEITGLFLTQYGNQDKTIQPLGTRVQPRKDAKDMH